MPAAAKNHRSNSEMFTDPACRNNKMFTLLLWPRIPRFAKPSLPTGNNPDVTANPSAVDATDGAGASLVMTPQLGRRPAASGLSASWIPLTYLVEGAKRRIVSSFRSNGMVRRALPPARKQTGTRRRLRRPEGPHTFTAISFFLFYRTGLQNCRPPSLESQEYTPFYNPSLSPSSP